MAAPLFRILANVVVAGASVGVKAFMQAYQQAAAGGGGARRAAQTAVGLSKQMKRAEAREILNVEEGDDCDTIKGSFETLMKANGPDDGGSFYLQSKVFRAHEKLMKDFDVDADEIDMDGDGETVIKTEETDMNMNNANDTNTTNNGSNTNTNTNTNTGTDNNEKKV
jgi:mitochondrial import inner membrane translocase subunit TIM16